tara:strand:+ start:158 stop:364 length:207 start_codon:yes stop_codon:yes gene_type:complete
MELMSIFGELFVSAFFGIFFGSVIGWGYYFLLSLEGFILEGESKMQTWKMALIFWFIGSFLIWLIRYY